jgi:hypothetical protein
MFRPMTRSELVGAIHNDLADRSQWDTRQSMFYEMRFHGLRRRAKPWPGASDMHFPLADSSIERLKPHYFQQLFATEQLAAFVPNKPDVNPSLATAAAHWFDHQLKQRSNLEGEILVAIDKMLMSGRPALKVIWDAKEKRLKFVAIPSHQLIVPPETRALVDADRIVHVQTYSVEAYKREANFNQDSGFIATITGDGVTTDTSNVELQEAKYRREGLTHGGREQIVLWEVWTRRQDGSWQFETLSPLNETTAVREVAVCPYQHKLPPFVDMPYEVTDAGYYSTRGVVEILSKFEAELCKLLNEKNDAMTLFNRPLFTTESNVPNAGNLRWVPGQILPFNVKPVVMPSPPIEFDRQIILMRDIAERLIAVPDFGMSQVNNTSDSRTATEIAAIGQMTQQSADLRMRVFRGALGRLYRMAWSLLLQYAKGDLSAFVNGEAKPVPPEALQDVYAITPSGSADGVNKSLTMNKAVARFQLFRGDPFVNQGELRKTMLEADDAGLVKRLFADPGYSAATQAEDQAQEISILRMGFPAVVSDADDHAVHIQTILAYVAHQSEIQQPPKPSELQFIQQHALEHVEALRKIDPKQAKQAQDALATLGAMLQQPTNPNAQTNPQTVPPAQPVA